MNQAVPNLNELFCNTALIVEEKDTLLEIATFPTTLPQLHPMRLMT